MVNRKNYKVFFVTFLAAVFACGLVSCASLGAVGQQTETSRLLFEGADQMLKERLVENPDGMSPDSFKAAFELKFPGAKFETRMFDYSNLSFTYEGKRYQLNVHTNVSVDETNHYILSARSCYDITK